MEVPTMLEEFLSKVIVYTPEAMAKGSMWWWILPLAHGVSYARSTGFANVRSLPTADELPPQNQLNSISFD
jgi:hypothetical protein